MPRYNTYIFSSIVTTYNLHGRFIQTTARKFNNCFILIVSFKFQLDESHQESSSEELCVQVVVAKRVYST